MHYVRWKTWGDPVDVPKRVYVKSTRTCDLDGCERKHFSSGLCAFHYQKKRNAAAKLLPCTIDGCNNGQTQNGLCGSHLHRYYRYGDAMHPLSKPTNGARLEWLWFAVFACLVTRTAECVIQPFSTDTGGYGQVTLNGRLMRMHIAVLLLTGREPPTGKRLHTRHLCGNPGCVNPFNIVVGTAKENGEDRVRHGTSAKGETTPNHKLAEEDVHFIRASGDSHAALARQFGVNPATIIAVRRRSTWAHLDNRTPDVVYTPKPRRALAEADVRSIRASTLSRKILAAQFSVSLPTICNIVTRKTWKHVT